MSEGKEAAGLPYPETENLYPPISEVSYAKSEYVTPEAEHSVETETFTKTATMPSLEVPFTKLDMAIPAIELSRLTSKLPNLSKLLNFTLSASTQENTTEKGRFDFWNDLKSKIADWTK